MGGHFCHTFSTNGGLKEASSMPFFRVSYELEKATGEGTKKIVFHVADRDYDEMPPSLQDVY